MKENLMRSVSDWESIRDTASRDKIIEVLQTLPLHFRLADEASGGASGEESIELYNSAIVASNDPSDKSREELRSVADNLYALIKRMLSDA